MVLADPNGHKVHIDTERENLFGKTQFAAR
jgi:hypothetical protein